MSGPEATALPPFADHPDAFLASIASRPKSWELLRSLAGTVAVSMKETNIHPSLAMLYCQAAARQLPDYSSRRRTDLDNDGDFADLFGRSASGISAEVQQVVEAVGCAVTKCTPRSAISQSGILPALARFVEFNEQLAVPHVEFLQACILAGQYRYGERIVGPTWPRPLKGISVQKVLRYFYLRGILHLNTGSYKSSIRCFWTCLSIPADIPSAIAICAWKKLVLVQCFTQGQTSTPPCLPSCLARYLNQASKATTKKFAASETPPATTSDVEANLSGEPPANKLQASNMGIGVYFMLVKAFTTDDRLGFDVCAKQHESFLEADGNMGLVNRCRTELLNRQVYQWSRMYSVIPLSQLTTDLKFDQDEAVQQLLWTLRLERGLQVQIDPDGMVVFGNDGDCPQENPYCSKPPRAEMEADVEELIQLTERIQKLDVAIANSPRFQTSRRDKEGRLAGPRGVEDF